MAKATFPEGWGLTNLEAEYLRALRPGKVVSEETLAKLHRGPLSPASRRVWKTMGLLRRKLDILDVEINTKWGDGWVLDRAARARITALIGSSK